MIDNLEQRSEDLKAATSFIVDNETVIPGWWVAQYVEDVIFYSKLHVDDNRARADRFFVQTMVACIYDIEVPVNVTEGDALSKEAICKVRTTPTHSLDVMKFVVALMTSYGFILTHSLISDQKGYAIQIFDQHEKLIYALRKYAAFKKHTN